MDFGEGGTTTGILRRLSEEGMGPPAWDWVSLIESTASHKGGVALATHVACLPWISSLKKRTLTPSWFQEH